MTGTFQVLTDHQIKELNQLFAEHNYCYSKIEQIAITDKGLLMVEYLDLWENKLKVKEIER